MSEIKTILMKRDNMSEEDAEELIGQAKEQLIEYLKNDDQESAEDICEEFFSLEPDYLIELLPY